MEFPSNFLSIIGQYMNIMNNNITTGFNIDKSDKYADTIKRGPKMTDGNFMTASSRDTIIEQIAELQAKKPLVSEQIGAARMQGGLEENEELHMALEDMQRLDMDINRHEEKLIDIILIKPLPAGVYEIVEMGTTVTIMNIETEIESTYTILGVSDSDPENGIISFKSPLGAELIGREVGDEVEIQAGNNISEYEVMNIVVN
jgi:transcription elongation factor GreA